MRLTWNIQCLDEPCGDVEVPRSRAAVAEVIKRVLPQVHVRAEWLTIVPLGNGRAQVNVSGFGPFGVLQDPDAAIQG
jgi:hypothetical protein